MKALGVEFVTIKQVIETLRSLQYKLRMKVGPIYGHLYMYGDNISVI